MQTIVYRCGLMLTFTCLVSISSASVVAVLDCVKALMLQNNNPVTIEPAGFNDYPSPKHLLF